VTTRLERGTGLVTGGPAGLGDRGQTLVLAAGPVLV
jgi:hypothetical protein